LLDAEILDADQITSAGLGTVECSVGAVEQIFGRLHLWLGEIGDADAHREAERIALSDVERVRLDLVAESLRERDRARFTRLGNVRLLPSFSGIQRFARSTIATAISTSTAMNQRRVSAST